jgi:hypothetical protein
MVGHFLHFRRQGVQVDDRRQRVAGRRIEYFALAENGAQGQ